MSEYEKWQDEHNEARMIRTSPPTVKEIIATWLKDNGFDGLFHDSDCGCLVEDLAPCCEDISHCEPGYRYTAPPDSEWEGLWIIGPRKPERLPEPPEGGE